MFKGLSHVAIAVPDLEKAIDCLAATYGLTAGKRYDNEERARATWLTSAHPRDGFKEFLERRPRST